MVQTAACDRHHPVDQQLCRWMLLSLDRLPSNQIRMNDKLIGNMLGLSSENVTKATGVLQKAGLIHYDAVRSPAVQYRITRGEMKTVRFLLLSVVTIGALGGISDAVRASVVPRTPVSPSSAASAPSMDRPAARTVPDAPAGNPRNPRSTPMPVPAPTRHYAGSDEGTSRHDFVRLSRAYAVSA